MMECCKDDEGTDTHASIRKHMKRFEVEWLLYLTCCKTALPALRDAWFSETAAKNGITVSAYCFQFDKQKELFKQVDRNREILAAHEILERRAMSMADEVQRFFATRETATDADASDFQAETEKALMDSVTKSTEEMALAAAFIGIANAMSSSAQDLGLGPKDHIPPYGPCSLTQGLQAIDLSS